MQDNEINMHTSKEAPLDNFTDHDNEHMFRKNSMSSHELPGEITEKLLDDNR